MNDEANRRVGKFIEDEIARQGINRAEVLRRGGFSDNKTLQTAIEGKRRTTTATRARIEQALDLDPGTLTAVERGEYPPPDRRRPVSDTELIAMLAERLSELRNEVDELRAGKSQPAAVESSHFNQQHTTTTSSGDSKADYDLASYQDESADPVQRARHQQDGIPSQAPADDEWNPA